MDYTKPNTIPNALVIIQWNIGDCIADFLESLRSFPLFNSSFTTTKGPVLVVQLGSIGDNGPTTIICQLNEPSAWRIEPGNLEASCSLK
jgi:hypothetical protein